MRVLTLKQPWASLVAFGLKTVETRKWATRHRGQIAIHAGKMPDEAMYARVVSFAEAIADRDPPEGRPPFDQVLEHSREVRGCVIALADLLDVVPMHKDHESAAWCERYPGAWAWLLDDIQRLEPLPLRGGLGLFSMDPALALQFRYPEEVSP